MITYNSRRNFIKKSAIGSVALATPLPLSILSSVGSEPLEPLNNDEVIKSFCIDFNWGEGCLNGYAKPGLWADADPVEHISWYESLGCNVVQTFAVSCNGYAWYKNGVIPEQPGLKHDFLTEMVKLGHKKKMKVMGYFCISSNTKWGLDHPKSSYGIPSDPHIPLTNIYLDYLCSSIEDALKKTNMDGFMIDWVWNPTIPGVPLKWLECEQKMFSELMGEPFPGIENIHPDHELLFRRKALDRCWGRIQQSAKKINPNCIIWLSCNGFHNRRMEEVDGSAMFKEVDWLMNEGGTLAPLQAIRNQRDSHLRLMTCFAGWNKQDPTKVIPAAFAANIGVYGFTRPNPNSLPMPIDTYLSEQIDSFEGDARNIATIARAYNALPYDFVKK